MIKKALLVVFSSCAVFASETGTNDDSTMRNLVRRKYAQHLRVANDDEFRVPITFQLVHLNDPEANSMLENFETDPEPVYNDRYLSNYVIKTNVRDYDTDPVSREIIRKCMEAGHSDVFLTKALIAAAVFNVQSIVDLIASDYDKVNFENEDFYGIAPGFTVAAIQSGNFSMLKALIMQGIYPDTPLTLATKTCERCPLNMVDEGIEFLRFLIVYRQEFDINQVTYDDGVRQYRLQLLSSVLFSHRYEFPAFTELEQEERDQRIREYRQKFVSFLLSLGADPDYPDYLGRTPRAIALENGISMEAAAS